MKKIGITILTLIILALIGIEIYCWVSYGGKPVSEIPSWVLFFLFNK